MSPADARLQKLEHRTLVETLAEKYGLEPEKFLAVIRATVLPAKEQATVTNEHLAAFLVVANQYDLNPFIREIFAFPSRNGGITPIVSVDGWVSLINRQAKLDGFQFEDHLDKDGKLRAVTCQIYRKDRSHQIEVTEYMDECKRDTEPWTKWPSRMLRHKALIQCARYAFGLSGIYDPDEAERIEEGNAPPGTIEVEPNPILAAAAPNIQETSPVGPPKAVIPPMQPTGGRFGEKFTPIGKDSIPYYVGKELMFLRFPNAAAGEAMRQTKLSNMIVWQTEARAWTLPARLTQEFIEEAERLGLRATECGEDWTPRQPGMFK